MNIKEGLLKKTVLTIFFLLASTGIAHAQRSIVATLSAADSSTTGDCPTANACVVLVMTDSAGSAAFAIGANASGNTIQFEASADYKSNWVPFLVYPSNSTTGVTSTTSVGPATFSASAGSYTHVRMRISTFVSGTATTRINQSPASASSGRGSGTATSIFSGPGFVPTLGNNIGINSSAGNKMVHVFANGIDQVLVGIDAAISPANNDCVRWNNTGGVLNFNTTGATCPVGGTSVWSALTLAAADLTLANAGFNSTFNHTSAVNWKWANTTAALVGASQSSPILNWCGTAWHAGASAADCMLFQVVPGTGADAAIAWNWTHSGSSSGTVTNDFPGPVVGTSFSGNSSAAQCVSLFGSAQYPAGFFTGFCAPAGLAASPQWTLPATDGSGNATAVTDGAQHQTYVQLPRYVAGAGSVNVMTATNVPAFSALAAGEEFDVLPNLANTTTTPTLNVDGLGAKTVTKCGTTALVSGDYTTTAIAKFIYDGTGMQLQNPFFPCPGVTGTNNFVLATSPTITTPNITQIKDGNANVFLTSSATASAVDSVTITNAATANPATVTTAATGTDTNINYAVNAKGSGVVSNSTFMTEASNRVAMVADWTCGTGGTVSSCVAATIIGSGGGTALTLTLPLQSLAWDWDCDGVVGQATGATANSWNFLTATNGATNVTSSYTMLTAATAVTGGATTDQASTTTTVVIGPTWTLGGTATKMPFHVHGRIEGASASGTVLSLQLVAPTVGDLVTIYRGAACWVR